VSQAGIINTASGPVPPSVPTSFVADVGTAVPAANVLNVPGGSETADVTNGIQTTASGNTLVVNLTNRIPGSGTTTDETTPVTLYTFPLGAVPGTYLFSTTVVGYNTTSMISAAYASFRTVRTTGAAGVLVNAITNFISEEGTMTEALVTNSISGNNLILTAVGNAPANTIDWKALTTYIFVS
jgi:hypothetical protein